MSISDVASLVGGAALGAPFSVFLDRVIKEAKIVKDFKPVSQDLASTMERLVPVCKEIDLMQEGLEPGKGELKFLTNTILRAEKMVRKCSRVQWYNIAKKNLYTREIRAINQDFLKFCQVELQLIQHRDHLISMRSMASVTTKIDLLSDRGKEVSELCLVPQPEEVTIFSLDRPLRELKRMLFEDRVVTIVVYAPSGCGKTLLVRKLCHDADVKGKFKQIFFIAGSKRLNVRLIVQTLLQHTGGKASEFECDLDSRICIQQLLKQLGQRGPILLVLDDVRPEEESLLQKFLIQFPDYRVLVTSRFEFPRFGPTYHLEPLIDEDVKNLFMDCAPQPNCLSCAKRDYHLRKILERCNGFGLPLAMNLSCSCSICNGCNSAIEDGISVNAFGAVWHPQCLCCLHCHKPIAVQEISNTRGKFHSPCYKEHRRRRLTCYICKQKLPSSGNCTRRYNCHPFWKEKYCPFHDDDGTAQCCSCERLQPRGTNYVLLDDGRWLCLDCMESSFMDTYECHDLHLEIRDYFESLDMKIEKEFPLLLVETQVLNKAKEGEKIDYRQGVIRGSCETEERIISCVSRGPTIGPNNLLTDVTTESHRLVHEYEVTAIKVMYGLPRLLTGSILAHEMMHAWLRLNEYNDLKPELKEGICQVIAHKWLESKTYAHTNDAAASSSHTPAYVRTQLQSDFERKLVEFCKMQIDDDWSPYYEGFKKVKQMLTNSSLHETLNSIRIQSSESAVDDIRAKALLQNDVVSDFAVSSAAQSGIAPVSRVSMDQGQIRHSRIPASEKGKGKLHPQDQLH